MGVAGISYDDFCRLTVEEIEAVLHAESEARAAEARREWEIMRLQAFMTLSPFCQKLPGPHELLPFPWDSEYPDDERDDTPMTEDERRERERRHRESLGW